MTGLFPPLMESDSTGLTRMYTSCYSASAPRHEAMRNTSSSDQITSPLVSPASCPPTKELQRELPSILQRVLSVLSASTIPEPRRHVHSNGAKKSNCLCLARIDWTLKTGGGEKRARSSTDWPTTSQRPAQLIPAKGVATAGGKRQASTRRAPDGEKKLITPRVGMRSTSKS